jgi:uroporphyrinogen-III decarboxylase
MTIRERVAAALRGQPVDQIPFTIYPGMLPAEEERRLRALGLGLSVRLPVMELVRPNVRSDYRRYQENGIPYGRTTLCTPVGEVYSTSRLDSAYGSSWIRDHYIKAPDDYRTMEFIIRDTSYRPAYQAFAEAVREVGEEGYVTGNMSYSPLMEMRVHLLGLERFSLDMYDRPDLFFSLYDTMREKEREAYAIAADSPAEFVIYCGNCSPEVLGPERFERYCVPCYNELGELLHARGKLLGVHLDANNAAWKEAVAASAIDVVEAFTPAPDTDMSVADARAAWPDKVLWINFPSSLHLAPRQRIQQETRRILREAAPGRGLIVGITENIPDSAWPTSLPAIAEALAEASARGEASGRRL